LLPVPALTPADDSAEQAAELRRLISTGPGVVVVTGGQTGVDTEAAVTALRAGLPVHLVFPHGWQQEDGPMTAARKRRMAGASFHQLASADFANRTRTAVAVADSVVLLDPAGGDGCRQTARAAAQFGRPFLELTNGTVRPEEVAAWLSGTQTRVLLIAGCRASLLASSGAGSNWQRQVARIVAGARLRHDVLRGPGHQQQAGS
jgi:hypothetical protein